MQTNELELYRDLSFVEINDLRVLTSEIADIVDNKRLTLCVVAGFRPSEFAFGPIINDMTTVTIHGHGVLVDELDVVFQLEATKMDKFAALIERIIKDKAPNEIYTQHIIQVIGMLSFQEAPDGANDKNILHAYHIVDQGPMIPYGDCLSICSHVATLLCGFSDFFTGRTIQRGPSGWSTPSADKIS